MHVQFLIENLKKEKKTHAQIEYWAHSDYYWEISSEIAKIKKNIKQDLD